MTLRKLLEYIIETLRTATVPETPGDDAFLNVSADCIEFGNAQLPAEAPFVHIYIVPELSDFPASDLQKVNINIYCGCISDTLIESALDSIELAEKIMISLYNDNPILYAGPTYSFDQIYGNIAVSYLTLQCNYQINI